MCRPPWLPAFLVFLCVLPASADGGEPFRYPEAKHGKGELKYVNGLPVLIVSGTPEEIGEQTGVLAVKPASGLLNLLKDFLKERGWEKAYPLLLKTGTLMVGQFPPDHLTELRAAAKASGFDP